MQSVQADARGSLLRPVQAAAGQHVAAVQADTRTRTVVDFIQAAMDRLTAWTTGINFALVRHMITSGREELRRFGQLMFGVLA